MVVPVTFHLLAGPVKVSPSCVFSGGPKQLTSSSTLTTDPVSFLNMRCASPLALFGGLRIEETSPTARSRSLRHQPLSKDQSLLSCRSRCLGQSASRRFRSMHHPGCTWLFPSWAGRSSDPGSPRPAGRPRLPGLLLLQWTLGS